MATKKKAPATTKKAPAKAALTKKALQLPSGTGTTVLRFNAATIATGGTGTTLKGKWNIKRVTAEPQGEGKFTIKVHDK